MYIDMDMCMYMFYIVEHAQDLVRYQCKTVFYVKLCDLGDDITPGVKQVPDNEIYIEWPEGVRNEKWVDHFFERLVGGIRGKQRSLMGLTLSGGVQTNYIDDCTIKAAT